MLHDVKNCHRSKRTVKPRISSATCDASRLRGCKAAAPLKHVVPLGVRQVHPGLVLFPLEWVSHLWETAVAVFADLRFFPKRQVFGLRNPHEDLTGYRGACQFDFYRSRFRGEDLNFRRRRDTLHETAVSCCRTGSEEGPAKMADETGGPRTCRSSRGFRP